MFVWILSPPEFSRHQMFVFGHQTSKWSIFSQYGAPVLVPHTGARFPENRPFSRNEQQRLVPHSMARGLSQGLMLWKGPKIWLGYLTLLTPRVFWGTLRVLFTLFGAFEVEGEYIWDKPVLRAVYRGTWVDKPVLCAVYRVLWDFWVDKPVLRAVYGVLGDFWVDKPVLRAVYGVLGDFWVDKPVLRAVYRVLWDFWVDKPVLCAVYRVLGDFWVDKPVLWAVYGVLGDFWVDKPVLCAVYRVLRDLMVDKSLVPAVYRVRGLGIRRDT
ncbi:hypothetical protein C8F04DRAFT_1189985 [Mycena alexandri]|uniref:Uncharacterized protein n=1 Tax=Mycena alexandri TaxID=1745969 RepID=A0AAD6WXI6_9AGAR|nr:hypothetical protein C8F04DRAFT_1189985 [Mycena alexandri]